MTSVAKSRRNRKAARLALRRFVGGAIDSLPVPTGAKAKAQRRGSPRPRECRDSGTPETRRKLAPDVLTLLHGDGRLSDAQHAAGQSLRGVWRRIAQASPVTCGWGRVRGEPAGATIQDVVSADLFRRWCDLIRGLRLSHGPVIDLVCDETISLRRFEGLIGCRNGSGWKRLAQALDAWAELHPISRDEAAEVLRRERERDAA